MDWIQFRIDNAMRLFEWRVDVIRELDAKHPVTAHCIPMGAMREIGPDTYPVFQVGRLVDVYGYSGGCNHEEWSKLRWQHWCKMDMTRSASLGKPFWAAEMPAGASWRMWGGRDLDEGRVCTASDVKLYSLMQFAGGARGVFSPRWRPLLDGWHVGNFGFYRMDGSPTERSQAAGEIAKWANQPNLANLRKAKPVPASILPCSFSGFGCPSPREPPGDHHVGGDLTVTRFWLFESFFCLIRNGWSGLGTITR